MTATPPHPATTEADSAARTGSWNTALVSAGAYGVGGHHFRTAGKQAN